MSQEGSHWAVSSGSRPKSKRGTDVPVAPLTPLFTPLVAVSVVLLAALPAVPVVLLTAPEAAPVPLFAASLAVFTTLPPAPVATSSLVMLEDRCSVVATHQHR